MYMCRKVSQPVSKLGNCSSSSETTRESLRRVLETSFSNLPKPVEDFLPCKKAKTQAPKRLLLGAHVQPVGIPSIAGVHGAAAGDVDDFSMGASPTRATVVMPPGTGKTMLASRLAGILPPLSDKEALQVAAIYSAGNAGNAPNWRQRPFRHPHHSASAIALVGGGSNPQPGEITLAHKGVLFLDELPEFPRSVLEVLREPMENGEIRISRAHAQLRFPARFQLIAAIQLF